LVNDQLEVLQAEIIVCDHAVETMLIKFHFGRDMTIGSRIEFLGTLPEPSEPSLKGRLDAPERVAFCPQPLVIDLDAHAVEDYCRRLLSKTTVEDYCRALRSVSHRGSNPHVGPHRSHRLCHCVEERLRVAAKQVQADLAAQGTRSTVEEAMRIHQVPGDRGLAAA